MDIVEAHRTIVYAGTIEQTTNSSHLIACDSATKITAYYINPTFLRRTTIFRIIAK